MEIKAKVTDNGDVREAVADFPIPETMQEAIETGFASEELIWNLARKAMVIQAQSVIRSFIRADKLDELPQFAANWNPSVKLKTEKDPAAALKSSLKKLIESGKMDEARQILQELLG